MLRYIISVLIRRFRTSPLTLTPHFHPAVGSARAALDLPSEGNLVVAAETTHGGAPQFLPKTVISATHCTERGSVNRPLPLFVFRPLAFPRLSIDVQRFSELTSTIFWKLESKWQRSDGLHQLWKRYLAKPTLFESS